MGAAWVVVQCGRERGRDGEVWCGDQQGVRGARDQAGQAGGGDHEPRAGPAAGRESRDGRCNRDIVPPHKYLFIFV